jgi:putative ABC transport system substrate-binding protein
MFLLAGAITVPRAVRAQQKAMPVIGFLGGEAASVGAVNVTAFHQGLSDTGYIEGQSVSFEYRWAEGHLDRLPLLAAEFVGHNVALIVATGDAAALAAKNATSTIPIVFFGGGDPVTMGLVASLARPGGNLTGFGMMLVELMQKRVELISELVPRTRVIGLLINPNDPQAERFIGELQSAAHEKRLQLDIMRASTESEIDPVFASFGQLSAGALVVSPNALFISRREQIVALASRYAVPAIYPGRAWATAGGRDAPRYRYMFPELLADLGSGHNIVATMYEQAREGSRSARKGSRDRNASKA